MILHLSLHKHMAKTILRCSLRYILVLSPNCTDDKITFNFNAAIVYTRLKCLSGDLDEFASDLKYKNFYETEYDDFFLSVFFSGIRHWPKVALS